MSRDIHYIPGRLGLRSVMTQNVPGRAEALDEPLWALSGATSTHISPGTWSLTLLTLGPAALHRIVVVAGRSQSDQGKIGRSSASRLTEAGEMFGKTVSHVLVAKAEERSVVSILSARR